MNDEPQTVNGPYRQVLLELGKAREDVVVLGADLGNSTEISDFRRHFPERFFNVGTAEQNEVDIAVGLALEGAIPFVHSFGVFLTRRAYEQVCVQVALHRANVKLIGMIPGLTSRLGPTHQAIEDLSLMATLPDMTVLDPADATEITQLVPAIARLEGPVYTRMMRREVPVLFDPATHRFEIGRIVSVREGADVTLVSSGIMLQNTLSAARRLEKQGLDAGVLHVATLKPLDTDGILEKVAGSRAVVTVENHLVTGGLGSRVAEALAEGLPTPLERVGIRDSFAVPGTPDYLFEKYGLSVAHIVAAAHRVMERK